MHIPPITVGLSRSQAGIKPGPLQFKLSQDERTKDFGLGFSRGARFLEYPK